MNKIRFHSTHTDETEIISKEFDQPITTISNWPQVGTDITYIKKIVGHIQLVYISRIHPIKNLSFLLQSLRQWPEELHLELNIYGPPEDKSYYEICQNAAKILPSHITVRFGGAIHPTDISETIQRHHFFILPTLGENFGHAIFEAWAAARPVIISDKTPWRQLASQKIGYDLSLEHADLWIKTIERCALMTQEEWDTWCVQSHRYAHDYIEKSDLKEKYLELFL